MATNYTAPGVYVEEVPSGVRTIIGASTSLTAFVGTAPQGPTNEYVRIFNYGDYERVFGPMAHDSPLSYAVHQYFSNGGRDALVRRVVADGAKKATATVAGMGFEAVNEGEWGNGLHVEIKYDPERKSASPQEKDSEQTVPAKTGEEETGGTKGKPTPAPAAHKGAEAPKGRFSLVVTLDGKERERFVNLVNAPADGRHYAEVLASQSHLIRAQKTAGEEVKGQAGSVGKFDGGRSASPDAKRYEAAIADLERVERFNLLCVLQPTFEKPDIELPWAAAAAMCAKRRAVLLIGRKGGDEPEKDLGAAESDIGTVSAYGRNVAIYYPYVRFADPLSENRPSDFDPVGAVAGVIARTDATRGVWKAPAGLDAGVAGSFGPHPRALTDGEHGTFNEKGINCLRQFPVIGTVVWGARTARGADLLADEYKYLPVRRLALYIEETLATSLKWVVFEPNDEPLWSQIRLNVGVFMHDLFRQGAFQGSSPKEAYLVKCDAETTPQSEIDRGRVNIVVGFAPLKPAEFVIIRLEQLAGQLRM